jgi:hypothetical protein
MLLYWQDVTACFYEKGDGLSILLGLTVECRLV